MRYKKAYILLEALMTTVIIATALLGLLSFYSHITLKQNIIILALYDQKNDIT